MRWLSLIFWTAMGVAAACGLLVALTGIGVSLLPNVKDLEGCVTTTMYRVDLCPSGRHYVHLKDIAPMVGKAVVASEDTAFYSHHGFDWYEIEQTIKENMEQNHIHRGASTLTQQLAKNIWLTKERSYWRKGKEAYLTYEMEKRYSKDFILEKYLNVVQFGPDLFGVKDAAQYYFKTTPANLNLLEAVFLAFVLPNPDNYSKSFSRGHLTPFANKIIGIILKRMVQFKSITPEAYQFALNSMPAFPWTSLTQADFDNAHTSPTAAAIQSSQDEQDIDQFLSEDPVNEEDSLIDAPAKASPEAARVPVGPPAPSHASAASPAANKSENEVSPASGEESAVGQADRQSGSGVPDSDTKEDDANSKPEGE